jgi:Domain of unknown function (DUF4232)
MIAPPKPPARGELEALIKEARERQLRRRLLGAVGVAIAAALSLSIYALTIGGGVNTVAQPPAEGGRASTPLCRSNQLAASAGFQGATQTMLGSVTLVNKSGTACSVPQRRPLVSLTWRGKPLATSERKMLTGPPWPRAHILAPGAKAVVFFQWWSCDGPGPRATVRPTFALRLGPGLSVTARSNTVTPAFCGGLGGRRFLDVTHTLVSR